MNNQIACQIYLTNYCQQYVFRVFFGIAHVEIMVRDCLGWCMLHIRRRASLPAHILCREYFNTAPHQIDGT